MKPVTRAPFDVSTSAAVSQSASIVDALTTPDLPTARSLPQGARAAVVGGSVETRALVVVDDVVHLLDRQVESAVSHHRSGEEPLVGRSLFRFGVPEIGSDDALAAVEVAGR